MMLVGRIKGIAQTPQRSPQLSLLPSFSTQYKLWGTAVAIFGMSSGNIKVVVRYGPFAASSAFAPSAIPYTLLLLG